MASPLTPEERVLAEIIFTQIKAISEGASEAELVRILNTLDPDSLDKLLKSISVSRSPVALQRAILLALTVGGKEAITEMKKIAPKLQRPRFTPLPVRIQNPRAMAGLTAGAVPGYASPKPPVINFNISFNGQEPNALYWAQTRSGELITAIDEQIRLVVRKTIYDGMREQIDTRALAKRIKNVVGLHPRWANAVIKFESAEFQRLMNQGLKEQVARVKATERTQKYRDKLVRKRAEMIARTENAIAQNQGRYQAWQQADDAGLVDPQAQKQWITAADERTCPICSPLDGEIVPWREVFSIGVTAPIVHPNCRCKMLLIPPDRSE